MAAPPPLPAMSALLSSVPRMDSTFDQSGVRGRACAPDCTCANAVGSSRCALTASGSENAGIFTGRSPDRASATWVSFEPYHFMNAIALSLFGAEVELADLLGRRRVVGLDGVPRVLDDRRRVAAEDRSALLVGVELGDTRRRDRLQ